MEDIELFFSQSFEKKINKDSLYRDYSFPEKDLFGYSNLINGLSVDDIVDKVCSQELSLLTSSDVYQFSSLMVATEVICETITAAGNPGLKDEEIGKLLLADGKERKSTAYKKYGENHAKTATGLSLLFCLSNTFFLSGLGYIYPLLDEEDKDKLLLRLLLRDKLIGNLIQIASLGTINVRDYLLFLSDSTYIRRRSNVRTLLSILSDSQEYDFTPLIQRIEL